MSQSSDHSPADARQSHRAAFRFQLGLLLLWLASLALLLTGLGGPPLLDWDEGIVARVAFELSQQPWSQRLWPSYWGEAYLNKPPGLHLLVAAAIDGWRALTGAAATALPPAWLLRLVPALLSSLLAPLLALLQWRLRPGDRLTALLTGAIALSLLPLARHGHLLMLDGGQLVAMALLWWAVLGVGERPDPGRSDLAWGLLAGLATSALLLLKAPVALPVLAATLLVRLLERDLSRRHWVVLAMGLVLGLLPGLGWHGGHLLVRGSEALQMWLGQGFARVATAIEGNSGGPLTPVLEVLEGGWPWLPLWPFGLALAWRQRRSRAGLWCLGLTLLTAALVLPLRTQLPWYSLLLWPPFALVCAPVLAWLVRRDRPERPPGAAVVARIPRLWSLLGALLLLAGTLAILPFPWAAAIPDGARPASGPQQLEQPTVPRPPAPRDHRAEPPAAATMASSPGMPLRALAPVPLTLGAGLLTGGLLLSATAPARRRRGLLLLWLGDVLALALLFASPLWLWELNETWPVADGLALLRGAAAGSDGGDVRLWRQGERPSLSWYAGRQIRPEDHLNLKPGQTIWLLGLESVQAPGLRCEPQGRRGDLRLEWCQAPEPALGKQPGVTP